MIFPVVDAYLGLDSPYSYLASTQLDRIAAEAGASFNWIPLVSADLFSADRNPLEGAPVSGQYDPRYRHSDAAAWAEYYGVRFRDPAERLEFDPRLLARAAIAAGPELRIAMMMRLFGAVFVDNRTKIDLEDCVTWAEQIGLDGTNFRAALVEPVLEADRLAMSEHARARGVFGLPFFIAGARPFFGNDRLVLLEHHLKTMAGDVRQKARW
jgi:2-hydroxychromene-2-carboxylate isomerase